jgi:mannosyl-oligosaccharide alpha-1,3-glucosidase
VTSSGASSSRTKPDKKVLRISSRDLVERHLGEAVDAVALTRYDSRNTFVKSVDDVRVERVVVVGLSLKPKSVKVEGGKDVEWHFAPGVSGREKKDGVASVLTMKDPNVAISRDWDIVIQNVDHIAPIGNYRSSINRLVFLLHGQRGGVFHMYA